MKAFVVFAVVLVAAFAQEDLEAAIKDPAKFQSVIDCFLDRAPCSPATAGFRQMTPEAVQTGCANCTPEQKHLAKVFFAALQQNAPNEYDNFLKKFDPKGDHIESFLKSVEAF